MPATAPVKTNKYCGTHLRKEPKSFELEQHNTPGVWVSLARYKCLVVRQKIALKCKAAGEKALLSLTKDCVDYGKEIKSICIRREKQHRQDYAKHLAKKELEFTIKIIIATVTTAVLAGGVGVLLGAIAF